MSPQHFNTRGPLETTEDTTLTCQDFRNQVCKSPHNERCQTFDSITITHQLRSSSRVRFRACELKQSSDMRTFMPFLMTSSPTSQSIVPPVVLVHVGRISKSIGSALDSMPMPFGRGELELRSYGTLSRCRYCDNSTAH